MRNFVNKLIFCLIFFIFINISTGEELKFYPGIINVSTDVSDGNYSIEEISSLAEKKDLPIIIITDHFLLKVEYGIFPFQRIVKRKVNRNSILTYGIEKYLSEIEKINKNHPSVLLVPGVKVTPFYYWSGSLFKKNLTLNDYHKEMLIFGLEEKDIRELPVIGNYPFKFSAKSFFQLLLFFLIFISGIFLIKVKKKKKVSFAKISFIKTIHPYRKIGIFIILISSVIFFNIFHLFQFDQYHGNQKDKPYQNLIDYVLSKNGLIFWSAPEVKSVEKINSIQLLTLPYSSSLINTFNYTGFACFYEGYREVGGPSGIWDKLLIEYCEGKRGKPIWTIGEIDYHGEKDKEIDEVQTVFLLPKFDKDSVMQALKNGKCYALWRTKEYSLVLDKISMEIDGKNVFMGDEITASGNMKINCRIISSNKEAKPVKIKIIKNGDIVKIFESFTPIDVKFIDSKVEKNKKVYYRIDIEGDYPHRIFTNPVFIMGSNL